LLNPALFPGYNLPIAAFAAILFSFFGCCLLIVVARRWDLLDHPGHRSSHSFPVPRIGGIGIAAGFFVGLLICFFLAPRRAWYLPVFAGSFIALAFGLADDLRRLSPFRKLALQFVCAIVALGIEVDWTIGSALFAAVLAASVLWIVFFMNAFNFMDGMDGQSAIFGILVASVFTIPMSVLNAGGLHVFCTAFVLVFALLGFLPLNLSARFKIFMGDCGSQMVGFVLAFLLLHVSRGYVFSFFICYWPFVYDVLFTLVRRSLRGKNLFEAHRDHLYQRLLRSGMTHTQVLACQFVFMLSCFLAFLGSLLFSLNIWGSISIVLFFTVVYTAYVYTRKLQD
jgi:UDP-GlcNAc:undecaprenyl-phosphate/decaprenyl-phosphate GlcNAc-1-phosphate transferase